MATGFFDRLVSRLDKLDPESLQAQLLSIARERGFLETIFQHIQEGVMVITNDGILIYANRAAENFIGFEFEKLKNRSILRYLRDWDWESLINAQETVDEKWKKIINREIEVTYPEHRVLSFYAQPIPGDGASEGHVLLMLRDVTRDRLQEESTIENERIDAVKVLAAGVAHEIGNPLNALNIHLQLLIRELKEVENAETRAALNDLAEVAASEVKRLDAIIKRFLQAIRPAKPDLAPGDITEVLKTTLRVMQPDLENRCIALTINIPPALPAVRFDAHQIEQVFFNILKNAMEAVPDGGCICISITVSDIWLNIAFLDNGEGIPPEQLGHIFDAYHTTKTKGTGLGLMIVQRIIQEHGGMVETASSPGKGTCMTIKLPLVERRTRFLPQVDTVSKEISHE